MGNWHIGIHGIGSHHNQDNPHDVNKMAAEFVDKLKAAGHNVTHAHLHHGGAEDMLDEKAATRAGAFGPLAAAATGLALLLAAFGWNTQARAADMGDRYSTKAPPAAVAYDAFSGPYVGINIGYGWDLGTSAGAFQAVPLATLASLPQGFLGGIQAGYGFRPNSSILYLGIEGDIDGAALTGSSTMPGLVTAESKNTWLASLRADIGIVPVGHALFYGTLGWGWGGGEFTVNELFQGGGNASINPTMNGFVWGGGIKIPLGPNWVAGVKYLQYDYGRFRVDSPSTQGLVYTGKDRVDEVRAELLYKF